MSDFNFLYKESTKGAMPFGLKWYIEGQREIYASRIWAKMLFREAQRNSYFNKFKQIPNSGTKIKWNVYGHR